MWRSEFVNKSIRFRLDTVSVAEILFRSRHEPTAPSIVAGMRFLPPVHCSVQSPSWFWNCENLWHNCMCGNNGSEAKHFALRLSQTKKLIVCKWSAFSLVTKFPKTKTNERTEIWPILSEPCVYTICAHCSSKTMPFSFTDWNCNYKIAYSTKTAREQQKRKTKSLVMDESHHSAILNAPM